MKYNIYLIYLILSLIIPFIQHLLVKYLVRESVSRILRQGGKVRKCNKSLKKDTNKHQEDSPKFDNGANYLIRQILTT